MPDNGTISDAKMGLEKILSVDANKINMSFLQGMFAAYHDKESKQFKPANFKPSTPITLTPEIYAGVKEKTNTTLGMLCFNRYVLEAPGVIGASGYWNQVLDADGLSDFSRFITTLRKYDKIDAEQFGEVIDRRDRVGFWCSAFLGVSISSNLIMPNKDVEKRKRELFLEKRDRLTGNDPVDQIMASNEIEKELIDMMKKSMEGDHGYDIYKCGAGNFNNNYKTVNIMRGAVYNDVTHKYDVVESSLMNGITKKDIPAFGNSVLAAAYPSAVGTAEAGYMSKIILSLMQSEHIDPDPNSDCGTHSTIPFDVTKKNSKYVIDRYINDNGKKVLLTEENIKGYIGKRINLYSPQCCKNTAICGKCGGTVFHNLGVTNVGLLVSQITQRLLNYKLKSKHDLSQSAGVINIEDVFITENNFCTIENNELKTKYAMKMFIPRVLDEISGFVREATSLQCFGVFPVKFYDKNEKEIGSTMMTVPAMLDFHIYSDIEETSEHYIVSYDPNSLVCPMSIQKTFVNVEFFVNQIYLNSTSPQLPYNMMTNMFFKCQTINGADLTGSSIIYEIMARRVCRSGGDTFAKVYGANPNVDQMSYTKPSFRSCVQESGALQGLLFQDASGSIKTALAQTLDGIEPDPTPLEKIIKA